VYSAANQAAPASSTSKFYDLGQFQVAINGCQAASPMGELWVEHEWTLIRRKQETPIGQQALYAHIVENPPATAATTTAYLGTTGGLLRAGSTINAAINNSGTTFLMPVLGTFLVAAGFHGSITTTPAFGLGSNLSLVTSFVDSQATSITGCNGGNAVYMSIISVLSAGTGTNNTVTISGGTLFAAGTTDIIMSQVNGAFALLKSRPSANQITDAFVALCERFDGLEKRLSHAERPLLTAISEPDTPFEEEKETELQSSVHISRNTAEQLARVFGLKK